MTIHGDHRKQELPSWLHQRALGRCHRPKQSSRHIYAERMQLESVLEGHSACVNCLEWNQPGSLLASGSDDCSVILWDPFSQPGKQKRHQLATGHQGNIFSVKFVPRTGDSLVATCATDCAVKCRSLFSGEPMLNCKSCHHSRVKRLDVHPGEPNLIWSAGEDGFIMQYDLRQKHTCRSSKPNNLLIDLNEFTHSSAKAAKCLAINPVREEQLAIGSDDIYVRVVDRRMLYRHGPRGFTDRAGPSFLTVFSPGHLQKRQKLLKSSTAVPPAYARPVGATYLAFSPNGRELLVNMHAEQAYLFNVQEPTERYKTYEATVEPLIMDKSIPNPSHPSLVRRNMRTYSQWRELKKVEQDQVAKMGLLTREQRHFYEEMRKKVMSKTKLLLDEHHRLNQLLVEHDKCLELYNVRARALMNRGWRGDYYQAIRDCCCSLALNPLEANSLESMALAMYQMKDYESVMRMLDLIKIVITEFGATELSATHKMLTDAVEKSKLSLKSETRQAIGAMMQPRINVNTNRPYNHHLLEQARNHHDDDDDEEDRAMRSRSTSPVVPPSDDEDDHRHRRQQASAVASRNFFLNHNNNNNGTDTPARNLRRSLYFNYTEVGSLRFVRNKLQWPEPEEIDETAPEAFDYSQRFCGHCNMNTDIKEVNFFGQDGEFIVGGSDDGAFYIWDKETGNIIKAVQGDQQILNCLQAHPSVCMLATSGIESKVKIWSPNGTINRDIGTLEQRCSQNQVFLNSDPMEAMIMMLYQQGTRALG